MAYNEQELLEVIAQTRARLIIDPFQTFLPECTNQRSITKIHGIFTLLGSVAKSAGTAIVLVSHLNKCEGSKDIQAAKYPSPKHPALVTASRVAAPSSCCAVIMLRFIVECCDDLTAFTEDAWHLLKNH